MTLASPSPLQRLGKFTMLHRWWIGMVVILVIGTAIHFTGYNFAMPYIDQTDEPIFLTQTLNLRGMYNYPFLPGYPPGIFYTYDLSQLLYERVTGHSAMDGLPTTVATVRVWAVLTTTLTVLVVGQIARWFAGDLAGWLAAFAWTMIPIVARYSALALAEPWLLVAGALAFYWALLALEADWAGWAVLSVLAGLFAFVFKYSAYPLVGPGVAAVLWRLLKQPRRYIAVLALQALCIAAVLLWLFKGYGAGQMLNEHAQTEYFLSGGIGRLLNLSVTIPFYNLAATQVGFNPLLLAALLVIGMVIFVWQRKTVKVIGWIFVAGCGALVAYLVASFNPIANEGRYLLPGDLGLVLGAIVVIVLLSDLVTKRFVSRYKYSAQVLAIVLASIWLLPQSVDALAEMVNRTLPDTRTNLVAWSIKTLDNSSMLQAQRLERVFNHEWGGYLGPYRVTISTPITARSLADWRKDHVEYYVTTQQDWDYLANSSAGKADLDQLLVLKTFPPAGQNWRGPVLIASRLWKMDIQTDTTFGGSIKLVGYDRDTTTVSAGGSINLQFYWKAIKQPVLDYSMFIHLVPLNSDTTIAQADGAPVSGRSTASWDDPGETLVGSTFKLEVPAGTLPGQYRVLVGLYDYVSQQRLTTADGKDSLQLFTVTVPDTAVISLPDIGRAIP